MAAFSEEWSLIEEHLYLSGILTATNGAELSRLGIKRILTIDIKPIEFSDDLIDYLFVKANDHWNEDILTHFESAFSFLDDGQKQKRNTLVHCFGGVSRSATIVIGYLMKKRSWSFAKALQFVRSRRTIVEPNHGFCLQLALFEEMRFKIDVTNKKYRLLLVNCLLYKHRSQNHANLFLASKSSDEPAPLEEYFTKLTALSGLSDGRKSVYKCKKCRLFLFNDTSLLSNPVGSGEGAVLLLEPLLWMKSTVAHSPSGVLHCPNCFTKLGNFDWNCSKGASRHLANFEAPKAFKINLKRVDCHEYN